MKGKMKAAVLYGPMDMRVESMDIPEITEDDILVRVTKAGVCGSDIPTYTKGVSIANFPQIIGHEFSAIVEEIGSNVDTKGLKVGDRVTGFNRLACGECFWCKRGEPRLCPVRTARGLGYGTQGAFAEYTAFRKARIGETVFKIPDKLNDYEGASIEPMAIGAGNVRFCGVEAGDKVVVLGAGAIGQGHLQMAKYLGATVAVVDLSAWRLDMAKQMGADITINPNEVGDAAEYVIDLWGNGPIHWTPGDRVGGMADKVIECTGFSVPFTQAFKMVRPGGVVQIVGNQKGESPVDGKNISFKMITVIDGVRGNLVESIARMEAGDIKTKPLMTHFYPLDNIVEAIEMQQQPDNCLKVMIDITD